MTPRSEIKKINEILKEIPGVDAAFIYGSVASGEATALSDIDIAFLSSAKNPVTKLEVFEKLVPEINKDIDVVCLNDASPALSFQILQNNIELFNKNISSYDEWKSRTLNKYWDLQISNREICENLGKYKVTDK